ncbi:MAG: hypothetical protein KDE55_11330, partial [Novosphingobium sp.]|nr:hypothetical protein [Novosphingobium sp.]
PGGSGMDRAITEAVRNVLLGDCDDEHGATAGHGPTRATAIGHYADDDRERVREWRARKKQCKGTAAAPYSLLLWLVLCRTGLRSWPFLGWARPTEGRLRWLPRPFVAPIEYDFTAKCGSNRNDPDRAAIAEATTNDAPLQTHTVRADAIATRLGHLYRSTYVAIFLLAALAVGFALAFIFNKDFKPAFVLGELIVLAIAFGLSRSGSSSGRNRHQRWLDARLVAESLRGEQLASWAGLSGRRVIESQPEAEDDDGHGEPRVIWTPFFANAVSALPDLPRGTMDAPRIGLLARATGNVIDDQLVYHRTNARRLGKFHHLLDVWGLTAIIVSGAISLLYLVAAAVEHGWLGDYDCFVGWLEPHYNFLSGLAAFAGGVGPAFAAALMGIRYHGDFERFANRSKQTAQVLEGLAGRAKAVAGRAGRAAEKQADAATPPLFEELSALILDTQATLDEDLDDWRFAYTARPVPMP